MRYSGHKLGRAIDAGSAKLTGIDVHEVEAVSEAVADIQSYDDIVISTW